MNKKADNIDKILFRLLLVVAILWIISLLVSCKSGVSLSGDMERQTIDTVWTYNGDSLVIQSTKHSYTIGSEDSTTKASMWLIIFGTAAIISETILLLIQ